ncbi:hypothetical protein ACFPL7_13060 [Dongia soli]|uniref:Uncharacterized protein n=1 Tax=Dongia soli TaxID=600628 RepID=A0ABU5EG73_9PROT|nr:hypothetical protein [Dongia soli]MDY0885004.1 hypothetical protein [Dongia soli]
MPEFGWETFYAIGALVLIIALAWGVSRSRKRNSANAPITQEATRAQYEQPEKYEREIRPELERKLKR